MKHNVMAGMDEFYGGATAATARQRIPAAAATPLSSSDSSGLPTNRRRMVRDPHSSTDNGVDRYIGVGLGVAGLICENVVSHPFLVLRRQCQVAITV